MSYRFNPPPGWPVPSGWVPPEGWTPEPTWPPAPGEWQFWVLEGPHSGPRPTPAPQPKPWFRRRPAILALIGLVLALVGGVTAAAVVAASPHGPTLEDAKRVCRTAFDDEFERRAATAPNGSGAIISVTDVEVQETSRTPDGFDVDGAVHYELASPLLPTIHDTAFMTCRARTQDGRLVTTVTNRN
jgi:hypothetical protein